MSGSGSRVSIPNSVRKMIQNIKEITGNDCEEIYAMLKECSMDPNETAQKLLLQDTFHEVKRKRDRRKEVVQNLNKESMESWRRFGMQGRVRGIRVNYSPHQTSQNAGGGRNYSPGKENGTNQVTEKAVALSLANSQEAKKNASSGPSTVTVMASGPTGVASGSVCVVHGPLSSAGTGVDQPQVCSSPDVGKLGNALPPSDMNKISTIAFETGDVHGQPIPSSSDCTVSKTPLSSSAVCFSSSDPVLLPSNDQRLPTIVGTIKREVGSQRTSSEQNATTAENKLTFVASEVGSSFIQLQGKASSKYQGVGKTQLTETSQPSSTSTQGSSSVSRPSSNYGSRSQQLNGRQKVGLNKEWKPKPTNPSVAVMSGTTGAPDAPTNPVQASAQLQPVSNCIDSEEATLKLQKKLEELHLPQRQHVILPNHIHVPESERTKLNFGSFGSSFEVTTGVTSSPESDRSSTPLSETSQGIEEVVEEKASSNQNALTAIEEQDFPDHSQTPTHVPENLFGDGDVLANTVPEYNESKQDIAYHSGSHQYSVVHTFPNYSFGFVPPMLGSQVAPVENSESQARDASRLQSFVPFDPSSYYTQVYRAGADNDGRLSPFVSSGATTKYNGNVTVLPQQSSQSAQEGGNSLVLSTAGPTALVTHAAGLMLSSMAMTQQPIPVYRPPTGMHISHYPPNYIPYGPHFSHPFYVPPPAIHQFLSNGAFPHQPQATGVYPGLPPAAATGAKFPLPQYKLGTNSGNTTHIGMPSGYGAYSSSPASYNPGSASAAGNTTSNEDLIASQLKESNVYMNGQQSEGSAVWIAAPGQDIFSLPANSFYNLPHQGQHVTYAPTQAGHGTFPGLYHPAQTISAANIHPLLQQTQSMAGPVDMVGPATNVYQQPQHVQINWPSNY